MFIVSRFLKLLPPINGFLSFERCWFLESVILHGSNALFLKIFVDFLIIHGIYCDSSP